MKKVFIAIFILIFHVCFYADEIKPGSEFIQDITFDVQKVFQLKDAFDSQKYYLLLDCKQENPKWTKKTDLPSGLNISPEGEISGIPTVSESTDINFQLEVEWTTQEIKPKAAAGAETPDEVQSKKVKKIIFCQLRVIKRYPQKESFRAIVGYGFARGSSTDMKGSLFCDLYFSQPVPINFGKKYIEARSQADIKSKAKDQLQVNDQTLANVRLKSDEKLRAWGYVRLSSIPNQNIGITTDKIVNVIGEVKKAEIPDMIKAGDFLFGLEYKLGEKVSEEDIKYSIHLIGGWGGITPIPRKETLDIYLLTDELKTHFRQVDFGNKHYIGLMMPDKLYFHQQYYGGLRLKKYTSDKEFPALCDLTIGTNEAATEADGGLFKRLAVKFDGFFTFKIKNFPFYIFGSAYLNLNRRRLPAQAESIFMFTPQGSLADIQREDIFYMAYQPRTRDYYWIGLGTDLMMLFEKN